MAIHSAILDRVQVDLEEMKRLQERLEGAVRTYRRLDLGAEEIKLLCEYIKELTLNITKTIALDKKYLERKNP